MPIESLACPNCGAPLPTSLSQHTWLCLYCNSLVRSMQLSTTVSPEQASLAVDRTLDEGEAAAVKQALLSGRRQEALQRYLEATNASQAEAEGAIDHLGRELSLRAIVHQQLTPVGWVYVGLWAAMVVCGLWLGLAAIAPWWLALLIAGIAAFNFAAIYPALATTIQYLPARVAPAVTLNYAYIGQARLRRENVHLYKVLLEVQPEGAAPFQSELLIPVRERNTPRLVQGSRLKIKYLAGKPERVIFHQSSDGDD